MATLINAILLALVLIAWFMCLGLGTAGWFMYSSINSELEKESGKGISKPRYYLTTFLGLVGILYLGSLALDLWAKVF